MKMKLGTYTFEWNPKSDFNIVQAKKINSTVDIFSGVAYYNWGRQIKGVKSVLEWESMSSDQYSHLLTLYNSDDIITWDLLGDGTIKYDVIVYNLEGKYLFTFDSNATTYRKDVKLELLIMG